MWTARLAEHGVALDTPGSVRGGPACWLLARLYREFGVMEAAAPLAIEALALELAVDFWRQGEAPCSRKPPPCLAEPGHVHGNVNTG